MKHRRGSKWWALDLVRKAWGPDATVVDRGPRYPDGTPRPTCDDERAAATRELAELRANQPTMTKLEEWPGQDTVAHYRTCLVNHRCEVKEWTRKRDIAFSHSVSYRFSVGVVSGNLILHTKGTGDSWEEALRKAGIET